MTGGSEPGGALHTLFDALERGSDPAAELVRDGLAELVGGVGEATVRLLELLDVGATLATALADPAVRDMLELCGLQFGAEAEVDAEPGVDVPVTITPRPSPRCEMCGRDRPVDHGHLADVVDRRLLCVCDACRILLEGTEEGRFRAVPGGPATLLLATDETPRWWDDLDIPVGLAFLLHRGGGDEIAVLYPGPAGVTETARPLVVLPDHLRPSPDVEAIVVLAEGGRLDAWRAPVTLAYELSGRLRHEASLGDPMAVARRLVGGLS